MSAPREPIRVITNATQLVEALAARGPLTAADVAESIGIPRSSAYRLIDGLTATRLADQLADGRVRLSSRWLRLSDGAQAGLAEWAGSAEILKSLVRRTRQTAALSVLGDGEAVCIGWCRGNEVLHLRPGTALPLYAGAAGRALLAYAVDLDAYLDAAPFPALTPDTLTDAALLRDDAERTRERGYALARGDVIVGTCAMGMPLLRPDGSVAGVVSIGGLSQEYEGNLEALRAALSTAVDQLTAVVRDRARRPAEVTRRPW